MVETVTSPLVITINEGPEVLRPQAVIECHLVFQGLQCTLDVKEGRSYKTRHLLNEVAGEVHPGEIVAIMGPSGAGKSTLLDCLSGRKTEGTTNFSAMLLNRHRIAAKYLKNVSGYVPQDDALLPSMTIKETLAFSALLRLPRAMTYEAKEERVEAVITELGLGHVADSQIGGSGKRGISGGERRRVSIGCELVTSPSIIFLDEPTSGLDSHTALQVLLALKRLAAKGHSIVTTLHQPSSQMFLLFDRLVLLRNGRAVYSGLAVKAVPFYARHGYECPDDFNPADYLLDTISSWTPDQVNIMAREANNSYVELNAADGISTAPSAIPPARIPRAESFILTMPSPSPREPLMVTKGQDSLNLGGLSRRSASGVALSEASGIVRNESNVSLTNTESVYMGTPSVSNRPVAMESHSLLSGNVPVRPDGANFFTQLRLLAWRSAVNGARDPLLFRAHFGVGLAMGLLLGIVYYHLGDDLIAVQDRAGIFFFICASWGFMGLTALEMFVKERNVFLRERASRYYDPFAYFICKALFDLIPLRVIPATVFGSVLYFLVGLRGSPSVSFFDFLSALVLYTCVIAALCLLIGIAIRSFSVANLVASLILLFFMLFGGFLISRANTHASMRWMNYVSAFGYTYEIFMVNELNGTLFNFDPTGYPSQILPASAILDQLGFNAERMHLDFEVLALMLAGYLLFAYIAMHAFLRESR